MISAGAASAADMPAVPYTPYTRALPFFSPIYSWTGFYIGAMGGYGWSDEQRATIAGQTFSRSSSDLKGGFAGRP
jgi:outer membrane immunogenic protein